MSNYLLLNTSLGLQIIDVNTIVRVEANSNYSKLFFTNNKTLVVAKTLQWLQCKLASIQFSRVHKTHLVNMYFITSYINTDYAYVCLENGEKVKVSRRRKKYFLEKYTDINSISNIVVEKTDIIQSSLRLGVCARTKAL